MQMMSEIYELDTYTSVLKYQCLIMRTKSDMCTYLRPEQTNDCGRDHGDHCHQQKAHTTPLKILYDKENQH